MSDMTSDSDRGRDASEKRESVDDRAMMRDDLAGVRYEDIDWSRLKGSGWIWCPRVGLVEDRAHKKKGLVHDGGGRCWLEESWVRLDMQMAEWRATSGIVSGGNGSQTYGSGTRRKWG